MNRLKAVMAAAIFLLYCAAVSVTLELLIYGKHPAGAHSVEQVVVVNPGQRFQVFSAMLHEANIIENPLKFKLFARMKGYDKRIKAGEYLFSRSMSPEKILDIAVQGKVLLHRLTIPEGYNLHQVARTVAESGFGTEIDFLKAATAPSTARKNGIDADTLEGYLFPDTYYFPKGTPPDQIISAMVKRFRTVFNPEWQQRSKDLGFSIHQIVTLASIIEKETGTPDERPVISSVFHNRLQRNMRLESDPTVIYGIENFDGNITREHLETTTAYNTYRISALPPGPIANTGAASIEAALFPAETPYLYFVSKRDKTHYFSTNITDHNMAVRRYQLNSK